MRNFLTLLLFAGLCTCVRAQVGGNVDAEYASWCMVDVLGGGSVNRFTRLVNIATLEVLDIDQVAGTAYTVTGTLYTCDGYDLQESTSNPTEDLYQDCQCAYTISQESHRVTEIRGAAVQEVDVEFQAVVRRKCSGQTTGVVVHRDTIVETEALTASFSTKASWSFSTVGEYVDAYNIRLYLSGGGQVTLSLDLDPGTVEASYPTLSLNPDDFEFDGSNAAAMAAAYEVVIDKAISAYGVATNEYSVVAAGNVVIISASALHQPDSYPYLVQPSPGDSDYLNTHTLTAGNPTAFNGPALAVTTTTSTYSEACEGIYVQEFAIYVDYDPDFPLVLQPRTGITTTIRAVNSNPTAFCDLPPSVCADLATGMVALDGCVSICDTVDVRVVPSTDTMAVRVVPSPDTIDVRVVPSTDTIPVQVVAMPDDCTGADLPGHQRLTGTSTIYGADTFHSLSLTVVSGTVAVTINGATVDYPSGYSTRWAAPDPCDRLSQSFLIDAASGSVIIAYIQ